MKTAELKEQTLEELQNALEKLLREQFGLRMRKAANQLTQTHLLSKTKKQIARLKTLIREKRVEV